MQVSVEKVSNVERRLTITVPASQVEAAYKQQLNQYAQKANIKGFRPGKAPLAVITQRFGQDAHKDAISSVIQSTLMDAIREQNLRPINQPMVEPKSVSTSEPLEYIATFEILPEMETIKFSMDKIEKLTVPVEAADVDRVIEQLRKQYTKWNLVDRGAQKDDRLVIDYYAIFEGKSDIENKIENFPIILGSGAMLPGFEDGLMGAKAGEERTLNLKFPEDFNVKERAGKPVDFVVQIKQVFEADMPKLDTTFIQSLGVKTGDLEEFKTQIRQSLEQERDRILKDKLKEQVFKTLLDQNPLDVPKSLIAREAKSIHDEVYQHQAHDHHAHTEEENQQFNDIASKRVALGLLMNEYTQQNGLKADPERVKARINEIASVYETPAEVIAYLSSDERRAGIESQVLEDQILDKLMENVPSEEKTMSYAELKGIRI